MKIAEMKKILERENLRNDENSEISNRHKKQKFINENDSEWGKIQKQRKLRNLGIFKQGKLKNE